jgi:hypothetical protein
MRSSSITPASMFFRGIGTATPSTRYTKAECLEAFQKSDWYARLDARSHWIARTVLQHDNGIEARRLAVDSISDVFRIDPNTLIQRFLAHAPALAAKAAEHALAKSSLAECDIGAVIVSTCTGYLCPGLSGYVVERLGLRADVQAYDLVGQGCAAALPNLQLARALLVSGCCEHVLSVCVESLPSTRLHSRESRSVSNLFAFKANYRDTSLDEGLLPILSFDGGYSGMVVADGGVTTLAGCIRSDYLGAYRRASPRLRAGEVVEALLNNQCKGVRMALQGASREGAWLAVGPLDPGIRLGAVDDPFRIGNAAGEAHPIIGEGISMALQSSWLLCGHLLGTDQPQSIASKVWQHEVGRRYAVEWRHHFASRLRLAAAFAHLAMRPVFSAPLVALARAWPAILTVGAKWGGKVRCAADLALIDRLTPLAGGAAESGGVPFREARQSGLTWR